LLIVCLVIATGGLIGLAEVLAGDPPAEVDVLEIGVPQPAGAHGRDRATRRSERRRAARGAVAGGGGGSPQPAAPPEPAGQPSPTSVEDDDDDVDADDESVTAGED
jgi:hypothetical protein